jgi:hypothetical protein
MLFDAVCDLLQKGHRKKPHHTPLDTINRLFQKHLKGKPKITDNPPWQPADRQRMVEAIARAFRWREMLENGTHATISEIPCRR